MRTAIVTGSAGLIGSESVRFFADKGYRVIGIDNDMRAYFFGEGASTRWNRKQLENEVRHYRHFEIDIRETAKVEELFKTFSSDIEVIIHAAAQPSHDWAAREPHTDFTVNANGTLVLLEAMRKSCPRAVFIHCSTNKVYGDTPNLLPLVEKDTRWELDPSHPFFWNGIDETMSIDQTKHSLFGASKVAADVLAQEYGRYFGLNVGVFRGGCLTGPAHSGAELHGFLAYLMKCCTTGLPYTVFGYKGKQVRDNIHSFDLVNAFYYFSQAPRPGAVYNMGGSRHSNCSMLEAIELCEKISGNKLKWTYSEDNRIGDHIWWISDVRRFKRDYPEWGYKYDLDMILRDIHIAIAAADKATPAAS